MNTSAIKAFVIATEENSFSQAAEKLHLTQPGISKRIQTLENSLNCQLFDRIGRRIFLTQAGEEFLPHAYRILQATQNGLNAVANLSSQVGGEFKVATTQHIGLHHLKVPVKDYVQRYPQVAFSLDFIHSSQAYTQVLQGKLELAVITEPTTIDSDLHFVPIHLEQLKFVCNNEHPLTQQADLTLALVSQYRAVLPSTDSYTRRIIDQLFKDRQLIINASTPSNYLEAIKVLVSAGLGWSVLPESLIDDSLHLLSLEELDSSEVKLAGSKQQQLNLARQIGYLVHKQRSLSNAGHAFIKSLSINNHI
ncbi:MAG: LysR family transcriptional regulator [Oceanospirillaceae bacterium]